MIAVALLVIVLVLLTGAALVYFFSYREAPWDHETINWWPRAQVLWLCAQGIMIALVFMVVFNFVLMLLSQNQLATASVAERVFEKAALLPSRASYQAIWNALKTDEDGQYKGVEPSDILYRKTFLSAYLVDPDKAKTLPQQDNLKLLGAVVREQPFDDNEKPFCNTGRDIFLVQWLTLVSGSKSLPDMGKGSHESCNAFIKTLTADHPGSGIGEEQERTCDLDLYKEVAENEIERGFGVNWLRDLRGLVGLDGSPSSPRQVVNALEMGPDEKASSECQTQIKDNLNQEGNADSRQVLMAQLTHLRSSMEGIYRAKALIWGPLQWLLLASFFAACIALGQRRSFGRNPVTQSTPDETLVKQETVELAHRDAPEVSDAETNPSEPNRGKFLDVVVAVFQKTGEPETASSDRPPKPAEPAELTNPLLDRFVQNRMDIAAQGLTEKDLSLGHSLIERSIKNAINEELDDDASYPIDLAKYVLPTVGFIGTVIGIAASLSSSGGVVEAAPQGVEAQLSAISLVTSQLGVAFDTTLLALAATAFVIFGHAYRRSSERRVVRETPLRPLPPAAGDSLTNQTEASKSKNKAKK
ncbi:MAG: MotA/TolQ/ExbB proton channel family protein [Candidatus Thiodiazotropha endolucinida]